jgi:iron complex outermembrane receptor protein
MKKSLTLLILIFISTFSFSQNFIKGSVADSTQHSVPFCALALVNAKDSNLVKGNISDSAGFFIFENLKSGNYFIKINSVGFKATATASFTIDSISQIILPAQILKTEGVNLNEVSITSYKPAIEFKKGMVVMNVENDLLARGNTVLELLKRIPGIIVDAQNNITINGIGGARFLIDDRLQQMPAPQVIDMLAAMSADAVSKIELIKNPPARYDAAGTGGLINIVTKKAKVKGFNGNIGFGASQGKRFRWGPSGSFNYKSNRLSVFTNFSYGHWDGLNVTTLERTLSQNGNTESINSNGTSASFQKVFFGSGGIEYDITKKMVLGFYVNGNHNNDAYVNSVQTVVNNAADFNYSQMDYTVNQKFKITAPNYNLSLLQKLDSTGGQIKFNAGYNQYLEDQVKLNQNSFYDANGLGAAPPSNYNSYMNRDFKVFTQKLDLNKTFKNKLSVEGGLKSSFVNNYNFTQLDFSNHSTGLFNGDTTFYNEYRYKERILAAYTTLSGSWDKIGFSFGLRAEQTDLSSRNTRTGYSFGRSYFNIFPSGSLDFTLNKKNTISTAYGYRIDRPWYDMMNPIRVFNEQLNYSVGNPQIKPQYTHNFTIDHNYNQFITQSIGYNRTTDFTFFYAYTPNGSKVNIDTVFNMPHRDNFYYSLSAQKRIKWYSFQTYAVVMYRTMTGEIRGQDVSSKTYNVYFNLNQEFYLPGDFKIQIWSGRGSGFQDGPQHYYPRSAIHLSVSKAFLDKKLNITLTVQDILYKDYGPYSNNFSDQSYYYVEKYDTRRVRVMINYRFGKMRIQQRINSESDSRLKTGK